MECYLLSAVIHNFYINIESNMITISYALAIYIAVILELFIWFLKVYFSSSYGGMFFSGKKSRELDLKGMLILIAMGVFTICWGGIFCGEYVIIKVIPN